MKTSISILAELYIFSRRQVGRLLALPNFGPPCHIHRGYYLDILDSLDYHTPNTQDGVNAFIFNAATTIHTTFPKLRLIR